MTNTNANPNQPVAPSTRHAIQRRDFADALATARSAMTALRAATTTQHAPAGRVFDAPGSLTTEALVTGLVYNALRDNALTLTNVARELDRLPDDCLTELGLRRDPTTHVAVTKAQVSRVWLRLAEAGNASPIRDGRRLPLDDAGMPGQRTRQPVTDQGPTSPERSGDLTGSLAGRPASRRGPRRALSAKEAKDREQFLVNFCDALLQASVPPRLRYEALTVDWTEHETAARPGNRRRTSADPDAGFGVRSEGTPFFGYRVQFAIGTGEADAPPVPGLAVAMRVTPADDTSGIAAIALGLLDVARAAGQPVTRICARVGIRAGRRLAGKESARLQSAARLTPVMRYKIAFATGPSDRFGIRVLGRAKRTLMLAVVGAAANIRLLRRDEASNGRESSEAA